MQPSLGICTPTPLRVVPGRLAVEVPIGLSKARIEVAPVDAAGLGAPSVEARAVAPARLAVDFVCFAFALPPGVAAREVAACALRALPNFQRLARTSCLWHAMNCSFQSWEFWRSFSTAHRLYCSSKLPVQRVATRII